MSARAGCAEDASTTHVDKQVGDHIIAFRANAMIGRTFFGPENVKSCLAYKRNCLPYLNTVMWPEFKG